MAPKRPIKPQPPAKGGTARKKKQKGPTQKTPMQRVMVINEHGKKQMVWREWA